MPAAPGRIRYSVRTSSLDCSLNPSRGLSLHAPFRVDIIITRDDRVWTGLFMLLLSRRRFSSAQARLQKRRRGDSLPSGTGKISMHPGRSHTTSPMAPTFIALRNSRLYALSASLLQRGKSLRGSFSPGRLQPRRVTGAPGRRSRSSSKKNFLLFLVPRHPATMAAIVCSKLSRTPESFSWFSGQIRIRFFSVSACASVLMPYGSKCASSI